MHAFWLRYLWRKRYPVREARAGEKLVTLDGEERELETTDLVITVADKPVALCRCYGWRIYRNLWKIYSCCSLKQLSSMANRSVRPAVASIFVLNHLHALKKGSMWQPSMKPLMRQRVWLQSLQVQLFVRVSFPAGQLDTSDVEVSSTLADVNRVLGTELSYADVEDVFRRLGFGLSGNAEAFTVSVPRRRWDITIEADLFEEIARIYGYDKLPATLPKMTGQQVNWQRHKKLRRQVRTIAEGAGLTEIITYALDNSWKSSWICYFSK